MQWFIKAVRTGLINFAATNIDDIFVLTLFFGQVGKRLHKWHVVVGQYLGILAFVAISLVGYFGERRLRNKKQQQHSPLPVRSSLLRL